MKDADLKMEELIGTMPNIVKDEELEDFESGNKWSHISLAVQAFGKIHE